MMRATGPPDTAPYVDHETEGYCDGQFSFHVSTSFELWSTTAINSSIGISSHSVMPPLAKCAIDKTAVIRSSHLVVVKNPEAPFGFGCNL